MPEEIGAALYPGNSEVVRLTDGRPFYRSARFDFNRRGLVIAVHMGVQEGRPVVNRVVIQRSLGALVRCDTKGCNYIAPATYPPGSPGHAMGNAEPMPCPDCKKPTLRAVPSSVGADGEVFSGPEFSASDLRAIPWGDVQNQAIATAAYYAAQAANHPDPTAAAMSAVGARRRRVPTDDLFQRVAAVVRDNPDAPTKAVVEQLFTSHRNASRWIGEARQRGLLQDTKPTKAPRTRSKS